MSDDQGLPALAVVMVVACAVLMFATNKFFGQPTFFSPDEHSSNSNAGEEGSTPRGGSGSKRRRSTRRPSGRSEFDGLPEFGVLEVISSFLSPADLIGISFVSTRFCRAAASQHLWKANCQALVEPRHRPLGEAWRLAQQEWHGRHEQEHTMQGRWPADRSLCCSSLSGRGCHESERHHRRQRRRPRLSSPPSPASSSGVGGGGSDRHDLQQSSSKSLPQDLDRSATSSCRSCTGCHRDNVEHSSSEEDEAVAQRTPALPPPPTASGGNRSTGSRAGTADEAARESPPSADSCSGACCDHACFRYSWREAFFRAHRAKPRDLLEELSGDQQPPYSPPLPQRRQRCVVIVHGNVHDLTDFLPFHPGGALILREHASTDATAAFERFFHSREARRMAKRVLVWDGEAVMGRRGTLWKVAQKRYAESSSSSSSSCSSRW